MSNTVASAPHRAGRPGGGQAALLRRHLSLAKLQSVLATWSERIRFRWELERRSKADPNLIDDIGLTRRQVESEIAKRFWQR